MLRINILLLFVSDNLYHFGENIIETELNFEDKKNLLHTKH